MRDAFERVIARVPLFESQPKQLQTLLFDSNELRFFAARLKVCCIAVFGRLLSDGFLDVVDNRADFLVKGGQLFNLLELAFEVLHLLLFESKQFAILRRLHQ